MTPAPKVLLVDDHPMLRQVLRDSLAGSGFAVREASTAAEAIGSVDADTPSVVVLDTKLPDADGVWAMREIRHRHPHVPVIMMSAFLSDEQVALLMEEGATACLSKETPFSAWGRTITAVLEDGPSAATAPTLKPVGPPALAEEAPAPAIGG